MSVDPGLLQAAIHAAQSGQRAQARRLFIQIVEAEPYTYEAWVYLSRLVDDRQDQLTALENALSIRPNEPDLLARRAALLLAHPELGQPPTPPAETHRAPLEQGKFLEESGQFEQAIDLYHRLEALSKIPTERIEARRRIDALQLRRESHTLRPVTPNLNLARIATGPALLFLLMLLMQSGLNLLHVPVAGLLGLLSVTAGGLLIAATEMRPAPPFWIAWFGQPGTGEEPEMRRWMRLLGWALLLAPFTMFLMEAGHRLGVLQSSVLGGLP